jgi:hypothetical protein
MTRIARELQAVMNPVGESSVPQGRGRGFSRHGQDHKELRRPQAERRIGMDTKMKMED